MTEQKEKEEAKEHLRIVVRMGDFEVELEGSHTNLESLMKEPIFKFIEKLQNIVSAIPPPEAEVTEAAPPTEYPPPLGKPASLGEALSTLIKTDWGKKPRSLQEIMSALETNGLYYKKAAVATTLVTLMKKKELRRLGSRGSYQYVAY